MFEVNEFFFALTGLIALIALFTISIKRISVDSTSVKIEHNRLITLFNSAKTIPLVDISKVEFEEGMFDRNTVLVEIYYFFRVYTLAQNYLSFHIDNKPIFRFKAIGTKNELKSFTETINQMKK